MNLGDRDDGLPDNTSEDRTRVYVRKKRLMEVWQWSPYRTDRIGAMDVLPLVDLELVGVYASDLCVIWCLVQL